RLYSVSLAMEDTEVERQENQNRRDEDNPAGDRNVRCPHHAGLDSRGRRDAFAVLYDDRCRSSSTLGTFALMPPQDQRAGDVDARVGSSNNADQEREGEIIDRTAAENIKRDGCQENRA